MVIKKFKKLYKKIPKPIRQIQEANYAGLGEVGRRIGKFAKGNVPSLLNPLLGPPTAGAIKMLRGGRAPQQAPPQQAPPQQAPPPGPGQGLGGRRPDFTPPLTAAGAEHPTATYPNTLDAQGGRTNLQGWTNFNSDGTVSMYNPATNKVTTMSNKEHNSYVSASSRGEIVTGNEKIDEVLEADRQLNALNAQLGATGQTWDEFRRPVEVKPIPGEQETGRGNWGDALIEAIFPGTVAAISSVGGIKALTTFFPKTAEKVIPKKWRIPIMIGAAAVSYGSVFYSKLMANYKEEVKNSWSAFVAVRSAPSIYAGNARDGTWSAAKALAEARALDEDLNKIEARLREQTEGRGLKQATGDADRKLNQFVKWRRVYFEPYMDKLQAAADGRIDPAVIPIIEPPELPDDLL